MKFIKFSICIVLAVLFFQNSSFTGEGVGKAKVRNVKMGKYDEYAFTLYEETKRFPKKNKLVAAVRVEVVGNITCRYKFVLKMPLKVSKLPVWTFDGWKGIVNGQQLSDAINTKSITHKLDETTYTISGDFQSAQRKGIIRGVYRIGALPVGNYQLYVFIDGEIVEKFKFRIHKPFR